jgi:hypothetical protein
LAFERFFHDFSENKVGTAQCKFDCPHIRMASSPSLPQLTNDVMIPPFRYSIVESGVHRSAHPTSRNFPFVRRLRLQSILSMVAKLDSALEVFVSAHPLHSTFSYSSSIFSHSAAGAAAPSPHLRI